MKKTICKKRILRTNFTPFMSKSCQIRDHFFPLTFPKNYKNLKSLDIGLWNVGAKGPFNGVRKSDGRTDRHTGISTYR